MNNSFDETSSVEETQGKGGRSARVKRKELPLKCGYSIKSIQENGEKPIHFADNEMIVSAYNDKSAATKAARKIFKYLNMKFSEIPVLPSNSSRKRYEANDMVIQIQRKSDLRNSGGVKKSLWRVGFYKIEPPKSYKDFIKNQAKETNSTVKLGSWLLKPKIYKIAAKTPAKS